MQMWYIDYSWYGAGYIRYGIRGTNGLITYVHQIQNNNKQFEAYMRSGNMAAHYEVSGIPPQTYLTAGLSGSTTTISSDILINALTIPVASTAVFNSSGGVARLSNELIFYTGLSTTTGAGNLLGCTRGFANTVADDQVSGTTILPSSMTVNDITGFPKVASGGATLQVKVQAGDGNIEYITYGGITSTGIIYNLTRGQTGGSATSTFTGNVTTSVELASPDSYLVNGQPFWDAGQHCWFNVPNVQGIVDALEQAYQRGRGEFPDTVAFAQAYVADKVYKESWRPLIKKLAAK
jgi:hypothetical protein